MADAPGGRASAAVWMLRVEGAAIIGLAIFMVVRDFGSDIANRGLLATLAVFAFTAGAFLLVSSRLLPIGRLWPRTPTLLVQFFIFIVAYYLLKAHRAAVAVPLLVIAIATAATVLRLGSENAED